MGESFFLSCIFKSPSMDMYYKCDLTVFFLLKSRKIHLEGAIEITRKLAQG